MWRLAKYEPNARMCQPEILIAHWNWDFENTVWNVGAKIVIGQ